MGTGWAEAIEPTPNPSSQGFLMNFFQELFITPQLHCLRLRSLQSCVDLQVNVVNDKKLHNTLFSQSIWPECGAIFLPVGRTAGVLLL